MSVRCKRTIRDIATLTGVSTATVSLALNNHPRISPATVLKVRRTAGRIGYKPGRASIRQGHTSRTRRTSYRKMQVALISQVKPMWLQTPVYSKVLQGIEDELGKINYNFIIRNLPEKSPELSIPRKIDGAILFHVPSMDQNMKLMRELRRISCVSVMGSADEKEFFDHVTYNSESIGKIAAEYLLSKGHKTLLYLGCSGRHTSFMSVVRKEGAKAYEIFYEIRELIDESGRMQLPNVVNFGNAIEKMKSLPKRPTAIFAPVDIIVAGLYHTLRHHDIIPGKDVELVGVNNDSIYLNHFSPRPASVDIHPELVGRKAVERLLWRIDNPKEPLERILLEPEMAFS